MSLGSGHFVVEQRTWASTGARVGLVLTSVAVGIFLGALIVLAAGHNPLEVYAEMVSSSFGSARGIQQTLRATTPLILTALAAAVAFKMRLWTIGAEGQLYIGAICASGIALALGEGTPAVLIIPAALFAGALGGAVWVAIAAVPRALFGTDEVVSTLMLNFIALHIMNWLIFGSQSYWYSDTSRGLPAGEVIPESAQLYTFWGRADIGIFVAVGAAVVLWVVIRWSRWGFELRVIGDSTKAAAAAGMRSRRHIISTLLVSGAMAGIAGATQVTSVTYALEPRALSAEGLGFTGIVVAAIAGLNALVIVPAALIVSAVTNSGPGLSQIGVSPAIVITLEGLLLLSVAGGQFFLNYRLAWRPATSGIAEAEPS